MRTILVSPRERTIRDLLDQASSENLILLTDDGREFLVAQLDNFDREIELTRQNEALMELLDARGGEKATLSLAEARAMLVAE